MPGQADLPSRPFNTVPQQGAERKPGQLTDDQLKQYFEDGFLQIDDFFDRAVLDWVREDIAGLVDNLAHKLHEGGKIKSLYEDYGLFQRLSKLEDDFPGASIILHKMGKLPPAFRSLWSNERLLNVMEQILGTQDIVGNPVWNLRCKTPRTESGVVPWHQDCAYMDEASQRTLIGTAWIPLLDTDENNGCMQMVRKGHRTERLATHQCCHGGTWYVMMEEDEMRRTLECDVQRDTVTCRVPYGGLILFSNMNPHRSLSNDSNDVRWALDLRFNRADMAAGLWGLKDGIVMRSSKDPDLKLDWEKFEAVDRTSQQFDAVNVKPHEFDTTIYGPWMKRWEIVHQNRHTEALPKSDDLQQVPQVVG